MVKICSHVAELVPVKPRTSGCEECLKTGESWVSLRLCLICGHVGCCNNSKNKHAQAHFQATAHPVIQAYNMGDDWKWCYVDKIYVGKRPNPVKFIGHIIHTKLKQLKALVKR